jgi:hypothetical protein
MYKKEEFDFKVGQRIVCVKPIPRLTYSKIYEVLKPPDQFANNWVYIENDLGKKEYMFKHRFRSLNGTDAKARRVKIFTIDGNK